MAAFPAAICFAQKWNFGIAFRCLFFHRREFMFRDALLESSPLARRRNALSMTTAFTLELIVGSVLVILPLISTGIISLSTRVSLPVPPSVTPLESHQPLTSHTGTSRGTVAPRADVVPIANQNPVLADRWAKRTTDDTPTGPNLGIGNSNNPAFPDLGLEGQVIKPPVLKRILISRSIDALLVKKVVPEYPIIARLSGIQGDVKLHAIISADGTIQSLTVMSGHATLIRAALDAVQQWRYRPYMLNGQAVEVETFITVSFKRTN
jgi:protein TonB